MSTKGYDIYVLISVSELCKDWNVLPNGVVHVGAHLGEEAGEYENFGWLPVTWIEAQPKLAQELRQKLGAINHEVIEAAIWHEDNVKLKLHVASNSQSSSLLNFGSHSQSYPDIEFTSEIEVSTRRLDSLINSADMPNFINLDIQGVELPAIKSLGNLIEKLDYIYVEVNRKEVYEGCTQVKDLDDYLAVKGFERVITRWYIKQGWGDALYLRKDLWQKQSLHQGTLSKLKSLWFYFYQLMSFIKHL